MTDRLHIAKPFARTHDYDRTNCVVEPSLSVRPDNPDNLFLGVYTTTAKRARYSNVLLTRDEARQIAAYLLAWADKID